MKSFFQKHKVLSIIGIIILLLFTCCICAGIAGSANPNSRITDTTNPSEQVTETPTQDNNTDSNNTGTTAPVVTNTPNPTPAVTEVNITSFVKEFDDNQLAAEAKYKGKMIKFTGYIGNISEDILGKAFVKVDPSNEQYYFGTSIQCYFKSKDSLLNIKNKQQVTLQGKFNTQSMNILVDDCQIM